jgi:hypothetical protein
MHAPRIRSLAAMVLATTLTLALAAPSGTIAAGAVVSSAIVANARNRRCMTGRSRPFKPSLVDARRLEMCIRPEACNLL